MNAIIEANIKLMLGHKQKMVQIKQSPTKYSLEYPDLTHKSVARYKQLTKETYTSQELAVMFVDENQEVQNLLRSLLKLGYVTFAKKGCTGGIYTVIRK